MMLGGTAVRIAHADTGSTDVTKAPYTLLTPLPCGAGLGGTNCTDVNGSSVMTSINLSDFISYAYKFMLALAVVLAVFMITVGGFEYMLSGAANTKSDALKKIQDAVWGLLLALVAYLLLYTIDPNLVSSGNLSIPPINYQAPATVQSVTNSNNANLNNTYQQSSPQNTVNQVTSPSPVNTTAPATTPAGTPFQLHTY